MLILTSTIWGECWLNKNTFLMTYVAWHSIVIPFITIKITHYLSESFLLYSTAQMGTKKISKRTLILAFSLPLRSSPKLLFFLMKPCLFLFWRRMSGCYLMKTFRNKYKYKEKTVRRNLKKDREDPEFKLWNERKRISLKSVKIFLWYSCLPWVP